MRRASYKTDWLMEDTNFMGVNLGADFTAEHEWGIEKLRNLLGVNDDYSVFGMDRRIIKDSKNVKLIEEKTSTALIVADSWRHENCKKIDDYSRELHLYDKDDMVAAWSGDDLGVRVCTEKSIKRLKRIHKAIMEKDAAIWLGGGHVFENAGLVVGIVSAIPLHLKKQMYDADADYDKLTKASEKTGIKQKIDALNENFQKNNPRSYEKPFGYYALSPAWKGGRQTKHPVVYWLNPQQQDIYNSNWYTVEDLELWLKGEGPVLKANAQTAKQ